MHRRTRFRRSTHSLRALLPVTIALAIATGLAGSAAATTITVNTTTDADAADGFCSLREAILAANDDSPRDECPAGEGADRIVFALTPPRVITLADHLPAITESLSIRGPASGGPLVLDGADLYRAITVESPSNGIWLGLSTLILSRGRSRAGDFGGGGAMIDGGATALIERVAFVANRSSNTGGGMMIGSGGAGEVSTVTVVECLFQDNVAEGPAGGGGLSTPGTGSVVTVLRSAFAGNHARNGAGGAIAGSRGFITLDASTISGNSAESNGGGIHSSTTSQGGAALLIRDTTITDNTTGTGGLAGSGGGLHLSPVPDQPLTVSLENSVVAGNFDLIGIDQPDVFCGANLTAFAATGSSLIGANDGCSTFFPAGSPNAEGDFVGTVAVPIAPRLQALADHGGWTPTHRPALVPLSPLIDQGSCPDVVTDQRGRGELATGRRAVDLPNVPDASGGDACDIGAFEVLADPLPVDPIFTDGFEAGHTLLWTTEVL